MTPALWRVEVPAMVAGVSDMNIRVETVPDDMVWSSGMWVDDVEKGFRKELAHDVTLFLLALLALFLGMLCLYGMPEQNNGDCTSLGNLHGEGSAVQSLGLLFSTMIPCHPDFIALAPDIKRSTNGLVTACLTHQR